MTRKRTTITPVANDPVTHEGETRTLREWCDHLKLTYPTVAMRYRRAFPHIDSHALFKPTVANTPRRSNHHRALSLLPAGLREDFLRVTQRDPQTVREVLKERMTASITDYVMQIIDPRAATTPAQLAVDNVFGADDPMGPLFARLPEAQQEALLQAFDDVGDISAELEYIAATLIPKAVARLTHINEDGTRAEP